MRKHKTISLVVMAITFALVGHASCADERTSILNQVEATTKNSQAQKLLPRDPRSKDAANVFWNRQFQLYDKQTDEPIFPKKIEGVKEYEIFFASNEQKSPRKGVFTEDQLEHLLWYKFKTLNNCEMFCNGSNVGTQSESRYSGLFADSDALFTLVWHKNSKVSGRCELKDGTILELEGENYADGKVRFAALNNSKKIGIIDLEKSTLDGTILWRGAITILNGNVCPVEMKKTAENLASPLVKSVSADSPARLNINRSLNKKTGKINDIFTVVQKTPPAAYSIDVTSDGKNAVFLCSDGLFIYEVYSGKLIKNMPSRGWWSLNSKIFFRNGHPDSILICNSSNHRVSELSLSDCKLTVVMDNLQSSIAGYNPKDDSLVISDRSGVSILNLKSGQKSKIADFKDSDPVALFHPSGEVGLLWMARDAGEEPSPWVRAFASSKDNFNHRQKDAAAVEYLLDFLGLPPGCKKSSHKAEGWETIGTDLDFLGCKIWLDPSLHLLPKVGWFFDWHSLVHYDRAGVTIYDFSKNTTLFSEGISATDNGDRLLCWNLDHKGVLSLAQSGNPSSRFDSKDRHFPSIFTPKELDYRPVDLGSLVVWNAAMDPSGHAAYFVTTNFDSPSSAVLRNNVSRYSSETWEFKTSCLRFDLITNRALEKSATTAPIWPLNNEYTEGSTWYFELDQPFRHTGIEAQGGRYTDNQAVWQGSPGSQVSQLRNPLELTSTDQGEIHDSKTNLTAKWKNSMDVSNGSGSASSEDHYVSTISWHSGNQQLSSTQLDGTVHAVFPLDPATSLVWVDESLLIMQREKNRVLSTLKFGENGESPMSRNQIAICPNENRAYFLSKNDGAISLVKWDSEGKLSETVRIYPQINRKPVLTTPENFYTLLSGAMPGVHFSDGRKTYPFEQFDLRLNRPDIVLERLGAPSEAVTIAKELREKRLKRMGVTEDMLQPDFHLPELEIVGDIPSSTASAEFALKIKATDDKYPLDRLHVYVNNVPVNGRDGELLRDQKRQSLEKTIPIRLAAGKNKIQVSVLNSAGAESLYANADVTCTAERPKPKLYAVAIGVSQYDRPEWCLKYAVKDATDLVNQLKAKAGSAYSEVKPLLLTDKDVTRESAAKIKDFLSGATIDDTVLVFMAGHGILDDKYDYYFGTTDIDPEKPAERGMPYDAIDTILAEVPSLRKALLMDTCHAGELDADEKKELAIEEGKGSAPPAPDSSLNGKVAMRAIGTRGMSVKGIGGGKGKSDWYEKLQDMFVDLRRGSGATVISSSQGAEYAFESSEQSNGLFTYALMEALDGKAEKNKDGQITISAVGNYVKKRVQDLTKGKQNPNLRGVNLEEDFPLAATK